MVELAVGHVDPLGEAQEGHAWRRAHGDDEGAPGLAACRGTERVVLGDAEQDLELLAQKEGLAGFLDEVDDEGFVRVQVEAAGGRGEFGCE